jgi:hypothetical protein
MKTSKKITRSVLIGAAAMAAVALTPLMEGAAPMYIPTVLVDNPEGVPNLNDTLPNTGRGSVGYSYYIGKYEITQGQWMDFLNLVATNKSASTAILGLWNSNMKTDGYSGITRTEVSGSYSYGLVHDDYKDRPVVFVSLLSAKRFCNWLTSGGVTTETGVYNMLGGANDVRIDSVWTNQPGAVALPTEDEWYKAAYYDPNKSGELGITCIRRPPDIQVST